jgi:hypothetical protein
MGKANEWDWERQKFAIPFRNESYDYLFNIDTTTTEIRDYWRSYWVKSLSGSDTLLQIYGINTGGQRLITALSPDSSAQYQLDPREIKANIITRKYSISNDWSPEFLSVIQPAGVSSLQSISVKDSLLIFKNKAQKIFIFDYKNLVLR